MDTIFVSGHLSLSPEDFEAHYRPGLEAALGAGAGFVLGDARGADAMAQRWLHERGAAATIFHMFEAPRNNPGLPTRGGFGSDRERDEAMTLASTHDLAWVRPGRERSGTSGNLLRRVQRQLRPRLVTWAGEQPDLAAMLLVGSAARGRLGAASDVDLVLLFEEPERRLAELSWLEALGPLESCRRQDFGSVRSLFLQRRFAPTLELGLTDLDWAELSRRDPQTRAILEAGHEIWHDPRGLFEA